MRKAKTHRVPRTRAGGEWTEARFWQFVRSGIRDMTRRYPPIARQALHRCRRDSQSDNARLKYEYQCHDCGEWFPRNQVQVDHIEPCGSVRSVEDVGPFLERALCEPDGLAVLCTTCHGNKTHGRGGAD